jgi:signal transduction histidine kinase
MIPILIKILVVLALPLVPLILARGLRLDRLLFALYLAFFLAASYFLVGEPTPGRLHATFLLSTFSLLWMNLFLIVQVGVKEVLRSRWERVLPMMLSPFPLLLVGLFASDYTPAVYQGLLYFPQPLCSPLTLVSAVLSLLMLTMAWETLERTIPGPRGERVFRLGIIMWWLVYFFILARVIYAGDMIATSLFQALFFVHLVWLCGLYRLLFGGAFLEVRAHPSPQFVGRATQSILVLVVLTLFFWFEALRTQWGLPPYSVTVLSVMVLAAILLFPLFPFRPFEAFQRMFYHHLYLPEQDFALEVARYLRVMSGEENLTGIMDHLRERLGIDAAALYRPAPGEKDQWKRYHSSPLPAVVPAFLSGPLDTSPPSRILPLQAQEETLGQLLLLGKRKRFHFEEEGLIRFWSGTLGLLLRELEHREKEKEQEKLTYFSQASSFLLHDAKNLAQLLDLLLKNLDTLREEDLSAFFRDSLSALEQARVRARRILEKLQTFQPESPHLVQEIDLSELAHEVAVSLQASLGKPAVAVRCGEGRSLWRGDPQALRIVLENLMLNGLQAAETDGPHVEVILAEEEGGYHLRIRDEGRGIKEEDRAKLFELFFTTKRGGSGLGLYQAKVLISRMGGRIWYEPNLPQGSIFHVWVGKDSAG